MLSQVQGKRLNGSSPQNLPQGYYYQAADVLPGDDSFKMQPQAGTELALKLCSICGRQVSCLPAVVHPG